MEDNITLKIHRSRKLHMKNNKLKTIHINEKKNNHIKFEKKKKIFS